MDENTELEILQYEPVPNKAILQKWLPILLYVQCIGIAVSVLSLLLPLDNWTTWISYIVTIATCFVLFQLASVCGRYRKSMLFQCVSLILLILNTLIAFNSGAAVGVTLISLVFTVAASVCSLIAVYQEYHAHADVIWELDGKLSKRWCNLFIWQIVVGVVIGFSASIFAVISVIIGFTNIVAVVILISGLAGVTLRIVYLLYLGKMRKLLKA